MVDSLFFMLFGWLGVLVRALVGEIAAKLETDLRVQAGSIGGFFLGTAIAGMLIWLWAYPSGAAWAWGLSFVAIPASLILGAGLGVFFFLLDARRRYARRLKLDHRDEKRKKKRRREAQDDDYRG